jgi:hypothetical protein
MSACGPTQSYRCKIFLNLISSQYYKSDKSGNIKIMPHCVRIFTNSEKVMPYREIKKQGKSIKLVSGMDASWEQIDVYEPENNLISILVRHSTSIGKSGETELSHMKESIKESYPVNAREWLTNYLSKVKTVYTFQLFGDRINRDGWPVLGRIQNLIKDTLIGILQADNEGFYNEDGDYILWQMYAGATGTIPAATLDAKNKWMIFDLQLTNTRAVGRFKDGLPPQRSFLRRLLRS